MLSIFLGVYIKKTQVKTIKNWGLNWGNHFQDLPSKNPWNHLKIENWSCLEDEIEGKLLIIRLNLTQVRKVLNLE